MYMQHQINWVRWYTPATPAPSKWKQEDQMFKAILGYITSSTATLGYNKYLRNDDDDSELLKCI